MPKQDPNDISNFKKPERRSVLTAATSDAPKPVKEKAAKLASTTRKGVGGKPKKAAKERRTEKVTLYLTEAEKQQLDEQSGLVPLATFLLTELQRSGTIPKK